MNGVNEVATVNPSPFARRVVQVKFTIQSFSTVYEQSDELDPLIPV